MCVLNTVTNTNSAILLNLIIHTEATLFRENYVNRLCKTWTAVNDSRLMVAHARILLRIELLKNFFPLYDTRKLCSKFGEDRSISNVTFLSTDAGGRTDGRLRDFTFCIALDRQ